MGITRQVAVEAVMLGEGVVNCVNPTSGVLMAVLAASGIPYVKWLRFMLPLALIWFVIGLVFICIGVMINWGPFKENPPGAAGGFQGSVIAGGRSAVVRCKSYLIRSNQRKREESNE